MPSAGPDPAPAIHPPHVERFRDGLNAALAHAGRAMTDDLTLGVAVSGGPDSLALLLLAEAALPGRVRAATVDHGLRPEAAAEARFVADLCWSRAIPHTILIAGAIGRQGGVQAAARTARYDLLGRWCRDAGGRVLATAHHVDDQAETMLLRLARGSGVGGLCGIRLSRSLTDMEGLESYTTLIRPLLDFTKQELALIVRKAGIDAIDDPANASHDFDRTSARALLRNTPWLDGRRLASVARHMAEADAALEWLVRQTFRTHVTSQSERDLMIFDPSGLPATIVRRVVIELLEMVEDWALLGSGRPIADGPAVTRLIAQIGAGKTATLGHVQVRGGARWVFRPLYDRRCRT